MKTKMIKTILENEVKVITPNIYNRLEKFNVTPEPLRQKVSATNKPILRRAFIYAFSLMLVVMLALTPMIIKANTIYGVLALDINPSLEISFTENETVKDITLVSEDGETLIDFAYKGKSLRYVLGMVILRAKNNGLIDNIDGALMYSVNAKNAERISLITQKFDEYSQSILSENELSNCRVINGQYNANLNEEAQVLKISVAKLILINQIIADNPSLTKEELKTKSIRYLYNLLNGD